MRINTPLNRIIQTAQGRISLIWNPDLASVWNERYERAQRYVDSEVIRLCGPYVPFETGTLQRSALIATTIGSGEVIWNAPYAKYLYYGNLMVSPTTGSSWARKGERKVLTGRPLNYNGAPKRGKLWFERFKADKGKQVIEEAKRIVGGR